MRETKSFDVRADGTGEIAGYFSTWTREPDAYGDVVAKGAFSRAIAEINEKGGTIPLLWNHDAEHLESFIGTAGDLEEDEHGAKFRATFDATPQAQHARNLAADGRLCKFSFAYDVREAAEVTLEDGRKARELRDLDLFEVSLTLYPANADTSVTEVKAGKRNSKADEAALRQAITLIQSVLGELEDEQDEGDAPANEEEPQAANSEEREDAKAALIARIKSHIE